MSNWGNYAVVTDATHQFEKEPEWSWTIKPPRSVDEMAISRFMVTPKKVTDPVDGRVVDLLPTPIEVMYREISLTFGSTTIPADPEDPKAGPLLKDGATVKEVEDVLKMMPHGLVLEIWGMLAKSCPGWGPAPRRDEGAGPN